ncbi:MAG: lysylphosphatidylglycerol synthase transmembrane domain-containing protein [Halanaerobiaceae bacterium]
MEDNNKTNIVDAAAVFKGLKIAISLSLLFSAILILMTLDKAAFIKAVDSINIITILKVIILILINFIAAGLKFKIMVSATGNYISLYTGVKLYLAGAFISNVTPMATGGGPFQIYFLHKRGINLGQGTMVILTQFILRIFFFTTGSLVFFVFFKDYISPGILPGYLFYIAFGVGFLITISLIIFSIVPGISEALINLLFKINFIRKFVTKHYKIKKLIAKGRLELREFHQSMELLIEHKMKVFWTAVSTIIYWTAIFMIIPVILMGMGYEPYFFKAYVMQTIFNLIIPYMPTPGASGIAEVGFASIFISFIPRGIIGIVTFMWRFATFYLILVIGGFYAIRELGWKRRKTDV